jgi:tetratricopeptide (TPR) repeat protein
MPGDLKSTPPLPPPPNPPRWPHVPTALSGIEARIAPLQKELERARGEYSLRHYNRVVEILDDIERRLPALERLDASERREVDFVHASLETLRGRLLSRRDAPSALKAFTHATQLFDQHGESVERHLNATRLCTDYGICLYRLGWRTGERIDQAIRVLDRVCGSGAAPPEAFGYLGYAELTLDNVESAETWLRKGIVLAPTDPTMLYWLARVIEMRGRSEEAADMYYTAGQAAWNIEDFASAARCGARALRLSATHEPALTLAVTASLSRDRVELARKIVDRFLVKTPASQQALGLKAMLLAREGDVDEAIALLRHVASAAPDLQWIRFELARILLTSDRADQAMEALANVDALLATYPHEVSLLRMKAQAHTNLQQFHEAVAALREVAEVDQSVDLLVEFGRALYLADDFRAAAEQLEKVTRVDPQNGWAHWALGDCLSRLAEYDRALVSFQRALRLDSSNAEVFQQLMQTLDALGRRQDMIDAIGESRSGPLRPLALQWKANLPPQDIEAAIVDLQEAADQRPDDAPIDRVPILLNLGAVQRQAGRYMDARRTYDAALKIDERLDTLLADASYLCDIGLYSRALERLKPALQLDPRNADSWGVSGWCHQHLARADQAVEAFRKAFEYSDKDPSYEKGLGNALFLAGRTDEARTHFENVLQKQQYQTSDHQVSEVVRSDLTPLVSPDVLAVLGWCKYRLGRFDEAIRLFQTVLAEKSHEYSPLWFDLALVLIASGRHEPGKTAYDKAGETVADEEPNRQRGLYHVALFDLVEARRHKIVGTEADAIIRSMSDRLAATDPDPEALPWLRRIQA